VARALLFLVNRNVHERLPVVVTAGTSSDLEEFMKAKGEISVGSRVKIIPQHWLRGYQEAVVLDFRPGAQNNWLVKFDSSYPGGGIEGDKLWLDESYFCEVKQDGRASADHENSKGQQSFFVPEAPGHHNGQVIGSTLPLS
jgi:hypothetical protein